MKPKVDTLKAFNNILQEHYGEMMTLRINQIGDMAFILEKDPVKLEKMRKHNADIEAKMRVIYERNYNKWLEKPLLKRVRDYLIEHGTRTDEEYGDTTCISCWAGKEDGKIKHDEFCELKHLLEELK